MKNRLLIIAEAEDILDSLREYFCGKEIELLFEREEEAAVRRVRTEHPHVVLLDITLAGISGLETLRQIKETDPRVCVIVITGHSTTQNAIEAMKKGAYDYLTKPLDLTRFGSSVGKAFQSRFLTRSIRFVRSTPTISPDEPEMDIMIGSSPEMTEIWKMVGQIANSDATVLIQGESGTGKELLARSIYNNSLRKNRPFLAVNCAALPENLLESELFGHEKGAFTDAVRKHIGRFEQCNGGTIFLDEIAELSPKNQAKLLRVLENQEFERIGGNETIRVDVRIIAATNRSLVAATKEKRFRLDLFYRLRVVTFFLPPLRERAEDIPVLAEYFAAQFAREYRTQPPRISPAAIRLLASHPWEGNIRELKNAINSAVVFSRGDTLGPENFSLLLEDHPPLAEDTPSADSVDFEPALKGLFDAISLKHDGSVYQNYISTAERTLIRLAMEKFRDNQVHAAKFLGISRNTLRQRLKEYDF